VAARRCWLRQGRECWWVVGREAMRVTGFGGWPIWLAGSDFVVDVAGELLVMGRACAIVRQRPTRPLMGLVHMSGRPASRLSPSRLCRTDQTC
jgi:hypothetical protein